MHHRGADGKLGEVADDLLRVQGAGAANALLGRAMAEDLALRDEDGVVQPEALIDGGDGKADRIAALAEVRPAGAIRRLQSRPIEELLKQGAPPGALGGEQNRRFRVGGQKVLERLRRNLQVGVGLNIRQGLGVEADLVLASFAEANARAPMQQAVQFVGPEVKVGRRQDGPLDVPGQALVTAVDLLPKALHGVFEAGLLQDQGVFRQMVEQAGQALRPVKEQRQIVLHPVRRDAGGDVLIDRAAPHIDVEGVMPVAAEAGDAVRIEGELLGRQQVNAPHPADGHLRLHIEVAQGVDFLVEQVDAQRMGQAHRVDVHQGAAHGELAPLADRLHRQIAGGQQAAALLMQVEALAHS